MYPPLGNYASARSASRQKGIKQQISRFKAAKRNYQATFGKVPTPGTLEYRAQYLAKYKASRGVTQVGEQVGSGGSKRNIQHWDAGDLFTKDLYSQDITELAKTSTNEINKRQRDIINLRGLEWRLDLTTIANTAADLIVNYAIISPKHGAYVRDSATPTNVKVDDFFRGYSLTRATNFSAGLSSNFLANGVINSDIFTVLMHKKVQMGSNTARNTTPTSRSLKGYLPIKRQIRYDDGTKSSCNSPIFFVAWQTPVATLDIDTSVGVGCKIQFERIIYFKEPIN